LRLFSYEFERWPSENLNILGIRVKNAVALQADVHVRLIGVYPSGSKIFTQTVLERLRCRGALRKLCTSLLDMRKLVRAKASEYRGLYMGSMGDCTVLARRTESLWTLSFRGLRMAGRPY
jgi:hypothetical protein